MTTELSSPLEGALFMHGLGVSLLRVRPGLKEPKDKGWPTLKLTAEEISENGGGTLCGALYNFGVNTGRSDLLVVDIDFKEADEGSKGRDPWERWNEFRGQYNIPDKETLTIRTPSGGLHFYFWGKGKNTVGTLAPGIDTRGEGGYVVAPGSIIGNKVYAIEVDAPIQNASVELLAAKAPAQVLDRPAVSELDVPSEITRAQEYLQEADLAVEGEGGDTTTFKVICQVRDFGITEEKAFELLDSYWNHQCNPPWEDEALKNKIANAYNYAQNSLGAKTVEAATKSAISDFEAVPLPVPQLDITPPWFPRIHQFNPDEQFPEDAFFLFIDNEGVIERGDVSVLQAKTKAGKSSAIAAMIASLWVASDVGKDFLGWRGENKRGETVLHFDTEQKPKDSQGLMKRALAMAGIDRPPSWFISVNIKGLTRDERRQELERSLKHQAARGTILAVFIDGIGDLCDDTNDKEKSERLGEMIVRWTQTYGCAVITVLHENPSAESQKMRGHLGTYLEMKAEAIFRLAKDEKGVFTLWAEKMRRGYIAKGYGPTWLWCKEAGRPVSTIRVKESKSLEAAKAFASEKDELRTFLIEELPAVGERMRLSELNDRALQKECTFANTARKANRFSVTLKRILDDDSEFKIFQEGGETSPLFIERQISLEIGS